MTERKFAVRCAAVIESALVFLSSCGKTPAETAAPPVTYEAAPAETSTETEALPLTEETTASETTTQSAAETGASSEPEQTEETQTETEETTETAEEAPETEADTAETAATAETTTEETTTTAAATAATTTAATTSAATTTPVTTAAPVRTTAKKSEPSPPVINKVSSDGTNVFECKKGIIDYSNADKGYISAIYLGSKKIAKLRINNGGINYDYSLYPDGKYHYFTLSSGNGEYSAKMFEQADGNLYSDVIGGSFNVKIADDVKMYTYTNDYIYFDSGSDCVAKASEVCGGCETDLDKIAAVFTYVADTISYDYELAATVKAFYIPNPDATLKSKKGVCFDYASLMAAMLRSQGIPTRLLIGYASDIYHAWNEVYTKETGWVTLEILLKDKGFNLLDSTFYSTASDKKAIADFMANRANYSTVYTY